LCIIIGRDCKNATLDNALSFVLGYTAGNDVSSRYWQWEERSGRQHGAAKGFDKFAPIGPVIVSAIALGDPQALSIKTIVNGDDVRQSSRTDDLIFKLPNLIQHLSRGTTLRKGTVIMTGTPGGVAAFMKPPAFLEDGDIVEVEIEKIGRLRNKLCFEK
jgi:2-keto-4-pentenoate hydratase/2-oxohepta-3-ene-1,7-dioic acid hydratase in catechol pathway